MRAPIAVVACVRCAACRAGALAPAPGGAHAAGRHEGRHAEHAQAERPPPLGRDLRVGWRAPPDHAHESRRGTPYVHAFHVEPAFLGRDLLLHLEREGDEHALEAEVEHALTRRLLLVPEVPVHWTDEGDGVGDLGLGLRALLVETDPFLLSAQVGLEFPTAGSGLGAGEVVVAPGLLAWADLGRWFTAQAGVGVALGTESEETELSWGVALAKSFEGRPLLRCRRHDAGHPGHWSLFLEGRGTHALSGPEEGASSQEALFGVSVPVTPDLDARAGWSLRWDDEDHATSGWVLGFVVHP